ncbi:MAG TPA: hypothetical protein VGA80_05310 [Flavobacteriaceae bacterium]
MSESLKNQIKTATKNVFYALDEVSSHVGEVFGRQKFLIDEKLLDFLNNHPEQRKKIIEEINNTKSQNLRVEIKDDKIVVLK